MPLPSSGQISVSDINTELSRTSNTANSNFAGGTTPQTGSLFKLGEAEGLNQTAPHKMSEWYSYPYEADFGLYGSTNSVASSWRNAGSSNWDGFGGTSCNDDINLVGSFSGNDMYEGARFQIVTNVNPPNNAYTNDFYIYFKYNVTSNTNMVFRFFANWGNLSSAQYPLGYDGGATGSGTFHTLVVGTKSDGDLQYLEFQAHSADQVNPISGAISITDINVVQQC